MPISRLKKLLPWTLLALAALAGILWWNSLAPRRAALQLIHGLRDQNWASLFDATSKKEREDNGWTEASFSKLASQLTAHLSTSKIGDSLAELFEGDTGPVIRQRGSEVTQNQPMWDSRSQRRFRWTPSREVVQLDGKPVVVEIDVLRDAEGRWRPCVGAVLILLNRCNRTEKMASKVSLLKGLEAANLPFFCEFRTAMVIRQSRIRALLAGEISESQLWEPRGSNQG